MIIVYPVTYLAILMVEIHYDPGSFTVYKLSAES